VFNSLKADCSSSYLLPTPPVVEQMPRPAALLTACSTLAPVSCTLNSSLATAPSSHSQYLVPCGAGVRWEGTDVGQKAAEGSGGGRLGPAGVCDWLRRA
jgi:hypothetical protein